VYVLDGGGEVWLSFWAEGRPRACTRQGRLDLDARVLGATGTPNAGWAVAVDEGIGDAAPALRYYDAHLVYNLGGWMISIRRGDLPVLLAARADARRIALGIWYRGPSGRSALLRFYRY
jgi:hypothetical protein